MCLIKLEQKQESEAILQMFDANMRLILQERWEATVGQNRYRMDLTGMSIGMYLVQLQTAGHTDTKKLLIAKD